MLHAKSRSVAWLLVLAMSGSCALSPHQSGQAPPRSLTAELTGTFGGGGYVARTGYFTESEIRDPQWEERRLARVQGTFQVCGGRDQIISRDVRWYPATRQRRQRCAAVVYTIRCEGRSNLSWHELDLNRRRYLRQDPEPAIEAGCGEKDWARRAPRPLVSSSDLEPVLSAEAHCVGSNAFPASPLRVDPHTRLQSRTLYGLGLQRRPIPLIGGAAGAIQYRFDRAQRVGPILRDTPVADDGSNILVEQHLARDPSGEGYCISLTARQAGRVWRREIHRSRFIEQRPRGAITDEGLSADPARYWEPRTDARLLANALADHLLAHAGPETEFRRRPYSTP